MKVTIELPDTFTIAKRAGDKWDAHEVTVETAKLHKDVLAELFANGVSQKVRDSSAGAQTEDESIKAMEGTRDQLYAGEWATRGTGGGGVDEFTRHARVIVRELMKAQAGGLKSEAWAEFTGMSDADQLAKIDANIEANREALAPAVEARIAEAKAKADAKRKLTGKVELTI